MSVCMRGLIDGRRIARINQLLRLARQRDDIVSDDADADVMKVIVRKERDVPLGLPSAHGICCSGHGC